jgi:hypothetical protein
MLRRPLLQHHLHHASHRPILSQPLRPVLRPSLPLQSRFFTSGYYRKDNPLKLVATFLVSFAALYILVKKKRGLGIFRSMRDLTHRPNESKSNR